MKKALQTLYFWPLVLSAVVIGLDQLTKQMALTAWAKEILPMSIIDGFFALTFAWNKGVSFSFLGDVNHTLHVFGMVIPADAYMPVILSLVALVAVWVFLRWLPQEEGLAARLAIGAIIGGALGNMVDRLLHGAVVDFILFYQHPYYFPAFNVADIAISCGVGLLILLHFVHTFTHWNLKEKEKEDLS